MGDAMVGSWGDLADVRPSSTKLGEGLKPETLTVTFNAEGGARQKKKKKNKIK